MMGIAMRACFGISGLLSIMVLLLTLAGCGGSTTAPGPGGSGAASQGNTLIYGRGGDANTLDPINTDIGEAVKVIVEVPLPSLCQLLPR